MGIAVTNKKLISAGSVKALVCDIDIESYTTGGELVDKATLGIGGDPISLSVISTEKINLVPIWDRTNKKLKLAVTSTAAELGNTVDGGTWRLRAEYLGG